MHRQKQTDYNNPLLSWRVNEMVDLSKTPENLDNEGKEKIYTLIMCMYNNVFIQLIPSKCQIC